MRRLTATMADFRAFALRGNVLDLAIAFLLGTAFSAVVSSLANDVLMNLVAALVGRPDFNDLTFRLGDGVIRYGRFLTAVVTFLIIAAALFALLRAMHTLLGLGDEDAPAAPGESDERPCPFCRFPIPAIAIACGHCTREVSGPAPRTPGL